LALDGSRLGGLVLQCPFESIQHVATKVVGNVLAKLVSENQNYDNKTDLRHTKQPLLVIHGKKDELFNWEKTRDMVKEYEGGPVITVFPETATHNQFELEQDLVEPLKQFLKEMVGPLKTVKPAVTDEMSRDLYRA